MISIRGIQGFAFRVIEAVLYTPAKDENIVAYFIEPEIKRNYLRELLVFHICIA